MIRASMTFCGESAEKIALSLEPDNLPGMHLNITDDSFSLMFTVEKIGTLLSTADDLLMNIKIAEETLVCAEEI
jgi:hypothetical protein